MAAVTFEILIPSLVKLFSPRFYGAARHNMQCLHGLVPCALGLGLGLRVGLGLRCVCYLLPVNAEQFRANRCATDKKAVSCQT